MKKLIIFILLIPIVGISISSAIAQNHVSKSLADIICLNYGYKLPYVQNISECESTGSGIISLDSELYNAKIFFNNRCSEFKRVSEGQDYYSYMYASFSIPNSNSRLCAVGTEVGIIEATDVLLIVDGQGKIYDELYCSVQGESLTIMQYSIDADMNITVYSIEADDYESVSLWDARASFVGHRVDRTYKISGGRFVLTKTVTGKSRIIKASDFKEGQWNLWDPFWKI